MASEVLIITWLFVTQLIGVLSHCGEPGKRSDVHVLDETSPAPEGQFIPYECDYNLATKFGQFRMVYTQYGRECHNGKWDGRVPKCPVYSPINITKITIVYGNKVAELFTKIEQVKINKTKHLSVIVDFRNTTKIFLVEFAPYPDEKFDETKFNFNFYLNKYRDCVYRGEQTYQFICEAKSYQDYLAEQSDLPSSFNLTITSEEEFQFRITNVLTFKMLDNCGTPDLPLYSLPSISMYNESGREVSEVEISVMPEHSTKYKLSEEGNYSAKCYYEGNWDRPLSELEPIGLCPMNLTALRDPIHKSYEMIGFEYHNSIPVAVIGSQIRIDCNDILNTTKNYTISCNASGEWNVMGVPCQRVSPTIVMIETKGAKLTIYNIIMIVSVILLVLAVIVMSVYIRRHLSKKNDNDNQDEIYDDVNEDDHLHNHEDNDYQYVEDYHYYVPNDPEQKKEINQSVEYLDIEHTQDDDQDYFQMKSVEPSLPIKYQVTDQVIEQDYCTMETKKDG